MDSFIALEVWIVSIAAPCILSWILGEMYGAARMRQLIEDTGATGTAVGETDGLVSLAEPFVSAPPKIAKASRSEGATGGSETSARLTTMRNPIDGHGQPKVANVPTPPCEEQIRQRRETFDNMPSLAELHENTKRLRASGGAWDDIETAMQPDQADPVSNQILQHFRGSIRELTKDGTGIVADSAGERAVNPTRFNARFSKTAIG